MTDLEPTSDSEFDDANKITDAASCLDYLKRREVFLYKMMNDPSHKAMLYFLEVLMNSDGPVTVEQLATRFSHKSFSAEMREACGGGTPEGLREFLQHYPSLFNVKPNGEVSSVAIELPGLDTLSLDNYSDGDSCFGGNYGSSSLKDSNYKLNSSSMNSSTSNIASLTSRNGPQKYHHSKLSSSNQDQKLASASCLSLASTQSACSFNNSSSSPTSNHALVTGDNHVLRKRDSGVGLDKSRSGVSTMSQASSKHPTLSSASSLGARTKSSNVYQPPPLRDLAHAHQASVPACELCPNALDSPHVAGSTCLHCPLVELSCHHHCTTTHHHHTTAHCHCGTAPFNHHCHSMHMASNPPPSREPLPIANCCSLTSKEKRELETEAVFFFQQRLLKRDERWVPIKSLAGHLSQASPEVRSVVGPQLEFRRFLLKYPQIFEVQGDLVSICDPFGGSFASKRSRDRFVPMQGSHSSTNLTSTGLLPVGGPRTSTHERVIARPKSLILSNGQTLAHLASPMDNRNRQNGIYRRSAHFADSVSTDPPYHSQHQLYQGRQSHVGSTTTTGNTEPLSATHTTNDSNSSSGGGTTWTRNATIRESGKQKPTTAAAASTTEPVHDGSTQVDKNGVSSSCEPDSINAGTTTTTNPNNVDSLSIRMSANEYRAMMFLRKVLEKKGGQPSQPGVRIKDLMHVISTKASEPIQATIGWTKIELEEFLNQHPLFFEIKRSDSQANAGGESQVSVCNKRLSRMICIAITGTKPTDSNVRTLTNRCGRIFHVTKLWGIIDLGNHEHVFFDKSIFRHVDDLQKHFKIGEILYFNAILAPKESRARWRATQVWKECDRENVEKLTSISSINGPPPLRKPLLPSNALSHSSKSMDSKSFGKYQLNGTGEKFANKRLPTSTDRMKACDTQTTNDDTEADEEIEDIDVENQSERQKITSNMINSRASNDSDFDFGLNGNEDLDDEEPLVSRLAREEGLNLVSDIKFLGDEVEEEIERILGNQNQNSDQKVLISGSDEPNGHENCFVESESTEIRSDPCLSSSQPDQPRPSSVRSDRERRNSLVTSSTGVVQNSRIKLGNNFADDSGTSSSLSELNAISIAVQTVSTGEIMATQLYHDYEADKE